MLRAKQKLGYVVPLTLAIIAVLLFMNSSAGRGSGQGLTIDQLKAAVIRGAGLRTRPVIMTAATMIVGLLPILFGSGTGSEVMSRIAAPVVGGMVSAVMLTLLVLPAVYFLWRRGN